VPSATAATTIASAAPSTSAAPSPSPPACTVGEPVVVERGVRYDAGLTLVTLPDGRLALGYATGAGVPRVALLDQAGKASFADLDTRRFDGEKNDAGTRRSILRVTPLGFGADGGMKMRVAIDTVDTSPGGAKALECGPADVPPFLAQGTDTGNGWPPIIDCRSFTNGETEWVMASVVRTDKVMEGGEPLSWILDKEPGNAPIDDDHQLVSEGVFKFAQLEKPEPHAYQAAVALGVAGTGVVIAARQEGALVMLRRSATLERAGKAARFYFGDAPTMPALAALDHQVAILHGLYQKTDVYGTTFPVETEPKKPEKVAIDDPSPPASGDRTLFGAAYTPSGNIFLSFADGNSASTKKARMTLLGGDLKSRVPVFDIGATGVAEIRVAALKDDTKDGAIVIYLAENQIKTHVITCSTPK
jgi:hypothetical protein